MVEQFFPGCAWGRACGGLTTIRGEVIIMYYPLLIILGFLLAGMDAWMMACVRDKLPLGLSILCKGIVMVLILIMLTAV